jgi:hypothetical protein
MARNIAETEAYLTSRRERKKIEMLFAHSNASCSSTDCDCADHARDEFHLAHQPRRTLESWPS